MFETEEELKVKVKELKRHLQVFNAFCEFLTIFASQEIGDVELDIDAISNYMCSGRFVMKFGSLATVDDSAFTEDDIYQTLEQDILDGMPVWDFFKLSDYTKEILESSFKQEREREFAELQDKYMCYRNCKWYELNNTSVGLFESCNCYKDSTSNRRCVKLQPRGFEQRETCNYYKYKKD